MSLSAVSSLSSLGANNNLQSIFQKGKTDFQQLTESFQVGDTSGASLALKNLQQDAPSSASFPNSQIKDDVGALSTALNSGNLSDARKAYSALQSDLQSTFAGLSTGASSTGSSSFDAGSSLITALQSPDGSSSSASSSSSHHHKSHAFHALAGNLLKLVA